MKIKFFALLIIGFAVLSSCEEGGKNEKNISKYDSEKSHNTGMDCMACHISGGEGEGWFQVAGTVYDSLKVNPLPNAKIILSSGSNGSGEVLYTIEGDALGNFYTTENIDFQDGLYAKVEGPQSSKYMASKLTQGACNSCHGNTVDKLWTN